MLVARDINGECVSSIRDLMKHFDDTQKQQMEVLQNAIASFVKNIDNRALILKNESKRHHIRYNAFNALTRHHLEELHTNTIKNLMDPLGDHDSGHVFLNAFFDVLLQDESISIKIPPKVLQELVNARVQKEITFDVIEPVLSKGRLDIQVLFKGLFRIVIENKIFHKEEPDQIKRYSDYCISKGEPHLILFLTLDGRPSCTNNGANYFSISYQKHILDWLNRCIELSKEHNLVNAGILFYRNILIQKILFQPDQRLVMDIKEFLLQKENHLLIKFQEQIAEAVIPVRNHLRTQFFIEVYKKLQSLSLEFRPVKNQVDSISVNYVWERKHQGLLLEDPLYRYRLKNDKVALFLIEHDWDNLYYGLSIYSYDEEKRIMPLLSNETNEELLLLEKHMIRQGLLVEQPEASMYVWKYYFPLQKEINFPKDVLNYDFAADMEKIVNEFVTEVSNYLYHFKKACR